MGDTHEVRLPDGRRVAYADHGDPAGPVITAVALVAPAEPQDAPAHGFVPNQDPAALRERGGTIARLAREGTDALEAFFAPDQSETDRKESEQMDPAERAVLPATGHAMTDAIWPEVHGWLLERSR